MAFLIVKYIHVRDHRGGPEHQICRLDRARPNEPSVTLTTFALKGIKFRDDRIANPAYGALLLTGLLMVFLVPLSDPDLLDRCSLVLSVLLIRVGVTQYTPTLRSQIKLAEGGYSARRSSCG